MLEPFLCLRVLTRIKRRDAETIECGRFTLTVAELPIEAEAFFEPGGGAPEVVLVLGQLRGHAQRFGTHGGFSLSHTLRHRTLAVLLRRCQREESLQPSLTLAEWPSDAPVYAERACQPQSQSHRLTCSDYLSLFLLASLPCS